MPGLGRRRPVLGGVPVGDVAGRLASSCGDVVPGGGVGTGGRRDVVQAEEGQGGVCGGERAEDGGGRGRR